MKKLSILLILVLILTAGLVVFAACGEPEQVQVTYRYDNGQEDKTESIDKGTYLKRPEEIPVKENYEFAGWVLSSDEAKYFNFDAAPIESDIVLIAKYDAKKYSVTYYDGESVIPSTLNPKTYTVLDQIDLVDAKKDGYRFDGWFTAAEGGTRVTKIDSSFVGDINLFAKFTYTNLLPLTFKYQTVAMAEQNPDDYATIPSGQFGLPADFDISKINALVSLNDEDIAGYSFNGWEIEGTSGIITEIDGASYSEGLTLIANITPIDYTISYQNINANATNTNPVTYTINTPDIVLAGASNSEGVVFTRWEKDGAPATGISKGSTGDVTFVAIWESAAKAINYSPAVYFDDAAVPGYEYQEGLKAAYSSTDDLYKLPEKALDGYKLSWELSTDGNTWTTIENGEFKPWEYGTSDLSFRAKYLLVEYNITYNNYFNYGGNGNADYPVSYNVRTENDIVLPNPTRPGYVFDGWTVGSINGTELDIIEGGDLQGIKISSLCDIDIYANWVLKTLDITYLWSKSQGITNGLTYEDIVKGNLVNNYTMASGEWALPEAKLLGHDQIWEISTGEDGDPNDSDTWTWKTVTTVKFSDYASGLYLRPGYSPTKYTILIQDTPDGTYMPGYEASYFFGVAKFAPDLAYHDTDAGNTLRNRYNFLGFFYVEEGVKTDTPFEGLPANHTNIGQIEIYALFDARTYTVSYQNIDGEAINPSGAVSAYTWDSPARTLPIMPDIKLSENNSGASGAFVNWVIVEGANPDNTGGTATVNVASIANFKTYTGFGTSASSEAQNRVAGNIVIRVSYRPYTVTYVDAINGNDPANPVTYTYETATDIVAPVARPGYNFTGWTLDGQPIARIESMTGDITLTANWTIVDYAINYVWTGIEGIAADSGLGESDIVKPEEELPATFNVEKETWNVPLATLTGHGSLWQISVNGIDYVDLTGNVLDFSSYSSNIYLRPKFALTVYNITYVDVADGNNPANPDTYSYFTAKDLKAPTKPGYNFTGWTLDGQPIARIESMTGDITLTANWTIVDYAINYVWTGIEGIAAGSGLGESDIVRPDEELPATFNVERETWTVPLATLTGHDSLWQISVNGTDYTDLTGNILDFSAYTSDIYLRPKFALTVYNITYVDVADGNNPANPDTYTYVTDQTLEAPVAKPGYDFVEWRLDSTEGAVITKILGSDNLGGITVVAVWAPTTLSITLTEGAPAVGTEFAGGLSTLDINIPAEVSGKTTYLVTDTSWTIPDASLLGHARTASSEENTSQWQYFDGENWLDITDNTLVFANFPEGVSIRPVFTPMSFDINVAAKAGMPTYSLTYEFGSAVSAPEAAYTDDNNGYILKNRYTFDGWFLIVDGTETDNAFTGYSADHTNTGDIEIYAKFTAITYTVAYQDFDESSIAAPEGAPLTYTWEEGATAIPNGEDGTMPFEKWEIIINGAASGLYATTVQDIINAVGAGNLENAPAADIALRAVYQTA